MATWQAVRLTEWTPDAVGKIECDWCEYPTDIQEAYVCVAPDGTEGNVLCLTCVLAPCAIDCCCVVCQDGGIDLRIPSSDEAGKYEQVERTCGKCSGTGKDTTILTGYGSREQDCWLCFGEGKREVYVLKAVAS